jgi:hypothetical protein
LTLTPEQARVRLNAAESHLKMARITGVSNIGVESCEKAISELIIFLREALA